MLGALHRVRHNVHMDTDKPAEVPQSPAAPQDQTAKPAPVREIGGPKGPEPTRYGDWEIGGRCSDF